MTVRATHKNARMTPRKLRPVATLVRGMSAREADQQLMFMPGKASGIIRQVLASAVANARENNGLDAEKLTVVRVDVNEGLKMRRFQPVSRGMAHPYLKRMSHVTVIVEDASGKTQKVKAKKTNIETISAEEYSVMGGHEHADIATEVPETELAKKDTGVRSVETMKDTEEGEAFQKTKMQQQGGDRKKTTRRSSKKK